MHSLAPTDANLLATGVIIVVVNAIMEWLLEIAQHLLLILIQQLVIFIV